MALMTTGWIGWRAWALLVARGAAALCIHLRLAWQAWHLATSTFVWRGRRGTWRHPPSFGLAGVALAHINFLRGRHANYDTGLDHHCCVTWSPISDLVALAQCGKRPPEQKFDIFWCHVFCACYLWPCDVGLGRFVTTSQLHANVGRLRARPAAESLPRRMTSFYFTFHRTKASTRQNEMDRCRW